MKIYQLARLSRGKARSRAPIIIGTKKLPRTAGMDGIRKKKTIVTPCIVNNLLYVSACTKSPWGVINSSRIKVAKKPRSEEHTSELQSLRHLVCRLLLEK